MRSNILFSFCIFPIKAIDAHSELFWLMFQFSAVMDTFMWFSSLKIRIDLVSLPPFSFIEPRVNCYLKDWSFDFSPPRLIQIEFTVAILEKWMISWWTNYYCCIAAWQNALDLTAPASDVLLKNRRSPWVQLSGHPGSFAPAGPGTLWKKQGADNNEEVVYQALVNDSACDIVPKYYRQVCYQGESNNPSYLIHILLCVVVVFSWVVTSHHI